MIYITPYIAIAEDEIRLEFMRASGPGGQHINKASTAAQLRFDIKNSPTLPDYVRDRMLRLPDRRITIAGILVISARRFRSREQNRQDAINRLIALIRKAAAKSKPRRKTRPPPASKRRRLESKRLHGALKTSRRSVSHLDD
ncbi:alternative ribosome rescue aminoacyl-tRNA hydrolase ArfB [Thermodesulfobacteriota bacterium]